MVAMSRLQLAWEIGYALRDPKLNCVQLPRLREKWRKPLRCRRQVALKLSASFYLCVARHEIEQSSISLVSVRAFVREKVPGKFTFRTTQAKPSGERFCADELKFVWHRPMFRTMRSNLKERNKPAMIRTYQPADLDRLMQLWLQGNLQAHPLCPGKLLGGKCSRRAPAAAAGAAFSL